MQCCGKGKVFVRSFLGSNCWHYNYVLENSHKVDIKLLFIEKLSATFVFRIIFAHIWAFWSPTYDYFAIHFLIIRVYMK